MIRTVEPETIADRIRDAIWGVKSTLGLKLAQVGDLASYPEPDQLHLLRDRCPCVLVIFAGASEGRRLQGQDAYGTTLRFKVHLLQFVAAGQNYERVMLQQLHTLVGLFIQGKFRLPGERIPGTVVRSCVPEIYEVDDAIALKEVSFGHAVVHLVVEADSHDFTPA
jgi:hypothetical protein